MNVTKKIVALSLVLFGFSVNAAEVLGVDPRTILVEGAEIRSVELFDTDPDDALPNPRSGVFPGTNIRHSPMLCTRITGDAWDIPNDLVTDEYNRVMKKAKAANPTAFTQGVKPGVMKKLTWKRFYVDDKIAPRDSAQARDPKWENYLWNTDDVVQKMLNEPVVASGEVLVALLINESFSGQRDAPPQWYRDAGFTFNTNLRTPDVRIEDSKEVRIRMDLPGGAEHIADFMYALVKKYSNSKLHSITLGEYFAAPAALRPPDFDFAAYRVNRIKIWQAMDDARVPDDDGTVIALRQTNPILSAGVTQAHLVSTRMGVSTSDVSLFKDGAGHNEDKLADVGSMERVYQDFYFGKILPVMSNGDSRKRREGQKWGFPNISNPFNIAEGERHVATPQMLYWNWGSKGVEPRHDICLKADKDQTPEEIIEAVKMFGRGGTHAKQWGVAPALP